MFEVKMVDKPEGLYMDIQDLIEYLDEGANAIDRMIKSDQLVGEFFAGEVYGYRKIAEHLRTAVKQMEG